MPNIAQLERRRRVILRGFEVGQLDNPATAVSIQHALTNIDEAMSPKPDKNDEEMEPLEPEPEDDDKFDYHPRPEQTP